jgi:endonuclease YncB( thermonuclease family)
MVKGKKVMIKRLYTDNYQRSVSIVYLSEGGRPDALSLNERQIQDGMAWVYDFFCTSQECNTWKFEEAMAKTRRIGIWKNPAPTPPWQWRALQGD